MDNIKVVENIKTLCKINKISIKYLLKELNLSNSFIYDFSKKGSIPSILTIEKIADYFEISIDSLIGRKPQKENISNNQIVSNNSGLIIGHNNSINNSSLNENENNLTSNPSKTLHLTEQEKDLLTVFNRSNGKKQVKIMNFIYKIDEEN